jgi:hypothetical protein
MKCKLNFVGIGRRYQVMGKFQAKMNRQGQQYIVDLAHTVKQLWVSMCEEEGIPTDSKFVVFSDDNKFMPFYNRAMEQLQEARRQFAAGGYVGLKIGR